MIISGRDLILILLFAALVALALFPLPWQKIDESFSARDTAPSNPKPEKKDLISRVQELVESLNRRNESLDPAMGSSSSKDSDNIPPIGAPPLDPVPFESDAVLNLAPGTQWVYEITGPKKWVSPKNNQWTMRIITTPQNKAPGIIEMGQPPSKKTQKMRYHSGAIQFEEMPFTEPPLLSKKTVISSNGEHLPNGLRLVKGAVWTWEIRYKTVYLDHDKEGNRTTEDAVAIQRDRALVEGFESVRVPAGEYGAYKVKWISRLSISVGERAILHSLTTTPYRKETMWISPGIGIVQREINYLTEDKNKGTILIKLVRYSAPSQ